MSRFYLAGIEIEERLVVEPRRSFFVSGNYLKTRLFFLGICPICY